MKKFLHIVLQVIFALMITPAYAENETHLLVGKECKRAYQEIMQWQPIENWIDDELPPMPNPRSRIYEAFPVLLFAELGFLLPLHLGALSLDAARGTLKWAKSFYYAQRYSDTYSLLVQLDHLYDAIKLNTSLGSEFESETAFRETVHFIPETDYYALLNNDVFIFVISKIDVPCKIDQVIKELLIEYIFGNEICGKDEGFRPMTIAGLIRVIETKLLSLRREKTKFGGSE